MKNGLYVGLLGAILLGSLGCSNGGGGTLPAPKDDPNRPSQENLPKPPPVPPPPQGAR